MIKLTFKENNRGKFDFVIIQNNVLFYQREYSVNKEIIGDPFYDNQKDLIKDFVDYLQRLINKKLEDNPNFHWKTLKEFKCFAGLQAQNSFFVEKEKGKEEEVE